MTMMPAIFADVSISQTQFVFKGARDPFEQVLRGRHVRTEKFLDHHSRNSLVAVREAVEVVDSRNFYS